MAVVLFTAAQEMDVRKWPPTSAGEDSQHEPTTLGCLLESGKSHAQL